MSRAEVEGLIRTFLAFVGGVLASYGLVDETLWATISGGLLTAAIAVWSAIQKRNAAKALAVAKASPAEVPHS
jgi:hypothetical protein